MEHGSIDEKKINTVAVRQHRKKCGVFQDVWFVILEPLWTNQFQSVKVENSFQ